VTDLAVDLVGDGDTVVLVHGSGVRDRTWSDQLALSDRYRLVMPYRRGYGDSPDADPDFEVDGKDVAELLDRPSHLVGFSYGGIGALLAGARRPELVRSVAVIEPPAFGLARGNSSVEDLVARLRPVLENANVMGPLEYGRAFGAALGFDRPARDDPEMVSALRSFMRERSPYEAQIPFERLRRVPALVVSGGWHPAFDAVCDVLTERLGAQRATFPGAGHGAQHAEGFNDRLLAFWEECDS
jgi:pimeloyl-ACP methyl ester carboxylesterase